MKCYEACDPLTQQKYAAVAWVHLCEQHALLLYVIGNHLNSRSSEDILAVIADKFSHQQEAQLNAMECCHKARLQDGLFCDRIQPNLHAW